MPKINHLGNADLPIGRRTEGRETASRETGDPRRPKGWHSRGYLPHFDGTLTQHVTLHLADSLPKEALERIVAEIEALPEEERDIEKRKRVDAWIDAGHGWCILREPDIARMVQNALLHFDAERYRLIAWVIMPNHAHVLFKPMEGWSMADIVASWKKFTARSVCDWVAMTANREVGVPRGPIWHREYWDRYMRDEYHFNKTIRYIHQNPVKAGLAAKAEDWVWSSAFPGNAAGNASLPTGRRVENEITANQEIGDPRKHT